MQEYEYEKTVLTEKEKFKQYFWRTKSWAVWLIFGICIFSLYVLLVGLIDDKSYTLHDGINLFSFGVLSFILLTVFYFSDYSSFMSEIYSVGENGKITMKLTVNDTEYMIENLHNNNRINFAKKDIESVDVYKKIIIIKLIPKRHLILPNKPEINEIFKDYLEVDDKQKRK